MKLLRRDLVSKAWGHLRDEKRSILGLAGLAVVAAQAESVALILIAMMADGAARGQVPIEIEVGPLNIELSVLAAGVATFSAIGIAALAVSIFGRLSSVKFADLERNTRHEIITSLASASWDYQSTQKSSRVQARLLRLMSARASAFLGLVGWIRAFATVFVFVVVAALMSPLVAGIIVFFGGLLSLAVMPVRRRVAGLEAAAAAEEVNLTTDVAEALDHGVDLHVFGIWPHFVRRFTDRSEDLKALVARVWTTKRLMPVIYQYGALTLIAIVLLGAFTAQAGGDFGRFAAAALLLLRSVQYGQQLQLRLQTLAETVPRIELLNLELETPPQAFKPGLRTLTGIESLELQEVGYSYPEARSPALTKVSIKLKPGVIVGMAGPSGSGKSTLAQILLRVRLPTHGEYLVNGYPATDYSAESWKRAVSHVPQHPRLLHGTLLENVTFLDSSISEEDAREVLEVIGLGGLVSALPEGLDAELGPTGRNLSGGQIQRLGIARALVRRPRLVILDEPTSALDTEAEKIVGEALETLRGLPGVVVVVIAHRSSTLALCDEFLMLDQGRISTSGHHDDVAAAYEFFDNARDLRTDP